MLSSFIPKPVRALFGRRPSITQTVTFTPPPEAVRDMARWQQRLTDINDCVRTDAAEELAKIASAHPDLADECCASLLRYIEDVLSHEAGGYRHSGALWALAHHLSPNILTRHEGLLLAAMKLPTTERIVAESMMSLGWSLIRGGRHMLDLQDFILPIDHAAIPALLAATLAVLREEHQGGRSKALRIIDWAEDQGLISHDEAVEAATLPQVSVTEESAQVSPHVIPIEQWGATQLASADISRPSNAIEQWAAQFSVEGDDFPFDVPVLEDKNLKTANPTPSHSICCPPTPTEYLFNGQYYPVTTPFTLNQVWRSKGGKLWRVISEEKTGQKSKALVFVNLRQDSGPTTKSTRPTLCRVATNTSGWSLHSHSNGVLVKDILLHHLSLHRQRTGQT